MRRCQSLLFGFVACLALASNPRAGAEEDPPPPQPEPTVEQLLEMARRFEEMGELGTAAVLYQDLVDRSEATTEMRLRIVRCAWDGVCDPGLPWPYIWQILDVNVDALLAPTDAAWRRSAAYREAKAFDEQRRRVRTRVGRKEIRQWADAAATGIWDNWQGHRANLRARSDGSLEPKPEKMARNFRLRLSPDPLCGELEFTVHEPDRKSVLAVYDLVHDRLVAEEPALDRAHRRHAARDPEVYGSRFGVKRMDYDGGWTTVLEPGTEIVRGTQWKIPFGDPGDRLSDDLPVWMLHVEKVKEDRGGGYVVFLRAIDLSVGTSE